MRAWDCSSRLGSCQFMQLYLPPSAPASSPAVLFLSACQPLSYLRAFARATPRLELCPSLPTTGSFSFLLMSPPHRGHPMGSRCRKHHHPIPFYLYFYCFIHSTYHNSSLFHLSVSLLILSPSIRMWALGGLGPCLFPLSPAPAQCAEKRLKKYLWNKPMNLRTFEPRSHKLSKSKQGGDFPGGPGAETLRSQCRVPGFDLDPTCCN